MGKREELIEELRPILHNKEQLEHYLVSNSNLPGPRSNLELAFAFAELYEDMDTLLEWLDISAEQADVNHPRSFLAFCSAVCLGSVYVKTKKPEIIPILQRLANDQRWRMREAVAFAFQSIGEHDFKVLQKIFSEWIKNSNNLEKRAILVALAHPPFLNKDNVQFCFEMTENILKQLDRTADFEVLKKGLEFTISVFVAADPENGFNFIEKWIGKNKTIDKILEKNLKKNRLISKNSGKVKELLNKIT